MAQLLDPLEIYDRGLADLDRLQGPERLIFILQDFDNLMEMEGWVHFFLYEHHVAWYAEMKAWLSRIGAEASLDILNDHEGYVLSHDCDVSPAGMEALLQAADEDEYNERLCEWTDQYCAHREDRWAKAAAFLSNQGLELLVTESDGTANDEA